MTTRRTAGGLLALGLLGWLLLAACNDNDLGPEKRRANRSPETILASGPPDSTYGTNYKVHLFWSGSDPDGTIDHYDFILIDHPAVNDSIAPSDPNDANSVVVRIPEPDDPRWTATGANDTLIVTRADTLRRALPPGSTPLDSIRALNFERWHTFFVRAVDNEGALDQTPEYRSFNSQTLAPTVELLPPVSPQLEQFSGPRVIIFNWEGEDPVGDGTDIEPIASRWTILPVRKDAAGNYVGYPDTLYKLPPSAWQPWRRWDARDKSGRQAVVKNLVPANEPGKGFYLFAVQGMDEAGAVTPVFDAETPGKNNVARVFVNDQVGATLTVQEKFLGTFNFVGGSRPVVLDVAAGQQIAFRWRGDASGYGGEIVAYRYGWNIRNPDIDEEWEQGWCETCRQAPVRVFNSGNQRFFLECRDNAETITRAEFELVVRQVTRGRDLLFVDDSSYPPDDPSEGQEDRRWTAVLDSIALRHPIDFERSRDVYDVEENRRFPPPLPLVFDYKTIVWTARAYSSESALKKLAYFFDPYVRANQNAVAQFNYLNIYIENDGEFWLSGSQLTDIIWPVSADPGIPAYPANITNWDDPREPHPEVDSVGTTGFLWKLGVEAVDLGNGSRAPLPRGDRLDQGCVGFRRATPQGYAEQTFQSSVAADHRHEVALQTSDVESPPAGGVTYTTVQAADHTHTVALTAAELRALARGDRVTVTTSPAALPRVHEHTYTFVDQIGLWGAPATLERDDSTWPLPPVDVGGNFYRGRQNVEIYNMASFMARQTPPLQPPEDLWETLYLFTSATPQNPNANPPVLYPSTADGEPAVILRRSVITDPYYARAISGFEPWRLRFNSHLALADYILYRHFRLSIPDSP